MNDGGRPPRLARALLGLRFRGAAREVVEGDLHEYFLRDLARASRARARLRYWRLVLGSVLGPPREDRTASSQEGPLRVSETVMQFLISTSSDVRQSVRRLAHAPGFTLSVVTTLALVIGVNAALFAALTRVVWSPLPFPDADRMVYLWRASPDSSILLTPRAADIERWRALEGIFDRLESFGSREVTVLDGGEPELVSASVVSPGLFEMLGVRPVLGRSLAPADLRPDAEPAMLMGHRLWRQRFGGDDGVIGRLVRLGEERWRVVGVMPADFSVPMGSRDLWLAGRSRQELAGNTVAVLRTGVGVDTAREALRTVAGGGNWIGTATEPRDMFGQTLPQTLRLLAGAVGLLLVMACVNVAGLLMARHQRRRHDLAVRMSLGASRSRLFRLLLTESAVLAAAGGAAGLLAARLALATVSALRPDTLSGLEGLRLDGGVVLFAALATLATTVLVGVLPAFRGSGFRPGLLAAAAGSFSRRSVTRSVLTAFQIAAALILVAGTLLLVRSLGHMAAVDPGYDWRSVVTLRVSLGGSRYADAPARVRFFSDLEEAIRAMPGVVSVARGTGVPPELGIVFGALEVEGGRSADSAVLGGGYVTPGYFSTLRVPILEGREFAEEDMRREGGAVIVSAGLARQLAGGASPLGLRVRLNASRPFGTIVGVASTVRANSLTAADDRQIYLPMATSPRASAVIVRTDGDPDALIPALRTTVWSLDPDLPIESIGTARDAVWRQTATARFGLTLLASFATIGIVLAAVGVFGVLMLVVSDRRREVAIRLSLGASHSQVVRGLTRDLLWVTLSGLLLGVVVALFAAPAMASLLFGIEPRDTASLTAAVATVLLASILAAVAPVRRMLAIEPAETLRDL